MTSFDPKELKNSKRIFKSATPKYTKDWYIKWIASAFVLTAMSIRGTPELVAWNDRALIMLNGAGILFLLANFIRSFIN